MRSSGTGGGTKKVKEKTPRSSNTKAVSSLQGKNHGRNTSMSTTSNERLQPQNSTMHQNLIDKLKKMEENMERTRRNSEAGLMFQNKSPISSGQTKYAQQNPGDASESLMQISSGEVREEPSTAIKEKYHYANLQKRTNSLDYSCAQGQTLRGIESNPNYYSAFQKHGSSNSAAFQAVKVTTPREKYITARRNSSNLCELLMGSRQETGDQSSRKLSPTNPLSQRRANVSSISRNHMDATSRSPSSPYFNMTKMPGSSPKMPANQYDFQKENFMDTRFTNKIEKQEPAAPRNTKIQLTENKNLLNQSSRVESRKQVCVLNASKSRNKKENSIMESEGLGSFSKLKPKHSLNGLSIADKDLSALLQKDNYQRLDGKSPGVSKSNSKKYIKFMKNMLNPSALVPQTEEKMANSFRKHSSRMGESSGCCLQPKSEKGTETQRDRVPISVRVYPCASYINSFMKQSGGMDASRSGVDASRSGVDASRSGMDASRSRVEGDYNSLLCSEAHEIFLKRDSSIRRIENSLAALSSAKNRDESHSRILRNNNSSIPREDYSASKLESQLFSPIADRDDLLVRRELNREDLASARNAKQSEQAANEAKGRSRGDASYRPLESATGNGKKRANISTLHQNLFEKLKKIEENIGMTRKNSVGGAAGSKAQQAKASNSKGSKGKKKEPSVVEEANNGAAPSQRRTCSYDYTNFLRVFEKNSANSNIGREEVVFSPKETSANNITNDTYNYASNLNYESQNAEVLSGNLKRGHHENPREKQHSFRGISPRSFERQNGRSQSKNAEQRIQAAPRSEVSKGCESRGKFIKNIFDRKHSEQLRGNSELFFIGDVSIDQGSELSFQTETKQAPKRQDAGFVVKNGFKSHRGCSIDYNAPQEAREIRDLLYKVKEDYYYTNKEKDFSSKLRNASQSQNQNQNQQSEDDFRFEVKVSSPEVPIASARFPSAKAEVSDSEDLSRVKSSGRKTREEILRKLLQSKGDAKSVSETKKAAGAEQASRHTGQWSQKDFLEKKEKLNSLYMQLKKLDEKKVFSPLTEKKPSAPLGDCSTRKCLENIKEANQPRGVPLSMEDIFNGRRGGQQGVKTPIKRSEEERGQINMRTDGKCYTRPSPNPHTASNASINLMEELELNRKSGISSRLEEKFIQSRGASAEDSTAQKRHSENPKNAEILNINCKGDFNLKDLCKMDSIFDTQNDIRNVAHMREKLIHMIRAYQNEEHQAPPTTLDFYKLIKLIGKGAFGKVHLAMNVLTEKYVAIKCIGKTHMNDRSSKRKIFNEITILKNISHPNIIRLLEVFSNHKYIFLVMEYAPLGDLLKYVKKRGKLEEKEAKLFVRDIALALKECHGQSILHRDIKLDNILLTDGLQLKLCDFGVSRYVKKGELINEQCGTPAYIAPEIISSGGYEGCQADLWSLGVVMYAMITGTIPFKGKNIEEMNHLILKGDYMIPEGVSPESADLIRKLLVKDPERRLNTQDVLRHPWLRDVTHPSLLNEKKQSLGAAEHFFIEKIDSRILKQLEEFGFDKESVVLSLVNSIPNHATACYHLLKETN